MINSLFEDKCTQCAPPGRSRSHHWRRGFVALVAAAAFLLPIGQAYADDDRIDIDRASWSNDRDRLSVRGDKAPDRTTVTLRYGNRGDNGAVIGTTQSDGDGDWEFRISGNDLGTVPCDVTAQARGVDDDDKEVSNAPNNCSNDGGVVQPPPDQACNISVSPTTLAFGDVTVGNSRALNTTVSNSGDAACDVTLAQSGSNDFAVNGGTSFSVAPGGNQSVSVSYTPGQVGADNGTLAVNSNDPDTATVDVALTGNGVQQQVQECNISVSPTSLAFGDVNLGNSPTLSTTVSNSGLSACSVNLARTGSNDFAITSATNFNVAPGGSTSVSVSYTPGQVGADTGNVAVNSNDPDTSTVDVGLSGNGSDNVPVACVETPGDGPQTHADCITSYTGPEVCVECHEGQARDMHGSVHYQQGGAFPNTTNIPLDFAAAGERPAQAAGDLVATGVNTYCGTHENSPRFTCAGCHVGNGRFPMAQSEFELMDPASAEAHAQLANIDCLTCHQDAYKRFPDWTANGEGFMDFNLLNLVELPTGEVVQSNGDILPRTGFSGIPVVNPTTLDFQFLPAGSDTLPASVPMAPMALTTLEAAQTVHPTTRQSCLTCHAGAGGGDGTKRGDMSKENANPSTTIDMHMSPAGGDLTCADCHSETLPDGTGHRVRGRGLDLRPNDVAERFTCENSGCHTDRPHGDFTNNLGTGSRDKHAQKVACQTCHIPSYAKAAVGTEVWRDWQNPLPSAAACNGRGGWLPHEEKGGLGAAELIPSYAWFDGTSEVYYLGEPLDFVPTIPLDAGVAASFAGNFNAGDPAYVLGMPNGDVASAGAKIYPMKEHWSKLAAHTDNSGNPTSLIGHSTFEFFRTGSFCRAVAVGLGLDTVNVDPSDTCVGLPGGTEMPSGTATVAVHTFQTINHGVEVRGNALGAGSSQSQCGDCHTTESGGPRRMDLKAMGYELTRPGINMGTDGTPSCSLTCHTKEHSNESGNLTRIHDRSGHMQDGCVGCHGNLVGR